MELLSSFLDLDLTIRSTLVIFLAWLGTLALRRCGVSAAIRHLAWAVVMIALLLLPALTVLLPELPIPILVGGTLATPAPQFAADLPLAKADRAPSWAFWMAVIYAAGAAMLLLRLACARFVLVRLWSSATETHPHWAQLVQADCAVLGIRRRVDLRLSDRVVVPMTWGTVAPKVLLPSAARRWSSERRHLVLLHELAHVSRADTLSRTAAALVCVLYWFNPLVWFAAHQMRAEQEQAADEVVLFAGANSLNYARCLVELAGNVGRHSPTLHAAATGGASQLERRIIAIVQGRAHRASRIHAAIVGVCGLITAWFAATAAPVSAIEPVAVAKRTAAAAASRDAPRSQRETSNTAIGSAPPEAAAPDAKPERMPAPSSTPPSRSTRPQRLSSEGAASRAVRSGASVDYARPPAQASGVIPPSRRVGLASVPASHPLSPAGVPSRGRPGDGPLPPRADFSP